jgi:beta-phosphoglucomutase-like phosphatase (HAD superfamily)
LRALGVEASSICMVGDSLNDVLAARAAGIPVRWYFGFFPSRVAASAFRPIGIGECPICRLHRQVTTCRDLSVSGSTRLTNYRRERDAQRAVC